jgi:hypothetical protein
MFEFADTRPQLNVQQSEYARLLGYPGQDEMGERARELADRARRWYAEHGWPWIFARGAGGLEIAANKIRLGGAEFCSDNLQAQFLNAEAHDAVLVAVSAGKECEEQARQCWLEEKPDEYFFMEMYGSAVVEHLITQAAGRICAWADQHGMAALPHYSPGYSGWPMTDQLKLMSVLRRNNGHSFPGELNVLDSGMLRPKKSLLAVFGLTRRLDKASSRARLIPCGNCSLPNCQYRRAPYEHSGPQIEDVRSLQPEAREALETDGEQVPALTRDAKYSLNPRALRKWSQERLELKRRFDGSVEARFRYEGTTCSNMGFPLEFHYRVNLAPPADGYRITDADCAPAPGDTGHKQQCEYLTDAAALMDDIAREKPLLGRSLNDVLGWERPAMPSGCYCDIARRTHKWGLVFEVIHFALVQQEKQTGIGHSTAIQK